jgi:hypothetical protein
MQTETLPVINLSTIQASEGIMKTGTADKPEIINMTSVDLGMQIVEILLSGNMNPLDFAVKKKLVIDAIEFAASHPEVKNLIVDEIKKHGKEAYHMGAKLSITSRPRYEYDKDRVWSLIKERMKPWEDELKKQEEKIKACCKNNASLIDEKTGEIMASVVPSPSSESVAVSFSKR